MCEVVEGEDKVDCEGIEKLVGISKTLLAKLVGAACDVPGRLSGSAVIDTELVTYGINILPNTPPFACA